MTITTKHIFIASAIISTIAAAIAIYQAFFSNVGGLPNNNITAKAPAGSSGTVKSSMGTTVVPNNITSTLINQLNQEAADESAGSGSSSSSSPVPYPGDPNYVSFQNSLPDYNDNPATFLSNTNNN